MAESNGQLVRQGDDRDALGRFAKGWKGGPGNPYAPQVARWRRELYACVTDEDIREVMRALAPPPFLVSPTAGKQEPEPRRCVAKLLQGFDALSAACDAACATHRAKAR